MDPHDGKIVINGATSQYDRWRQAPAADDVRVDGRSFAELLDFATRFAGLIHFYDLSDQVDGDWTRFFGSDSTMILASIEATDLAAIEERFCRRRRRTAEARVFAEKVKLLRSTFEVVLDLARRVDLWLEGLQLATHSAIARRLAEQITAAIEEDLGRQLRTLKAYAEGAALPSALDRPLRLDFDGFPPIWQLDGVPPDGSIYRGRTRIRKIDCALPHLNPIFYAFLYAVSDWQAYARAHFAATLEEADHRPQIALTIAFVKLFGRAQNTINSLSHRYCRFYYHDVLRERRRGPVGDHLYLTFTLADSEEVLRTQVPRGNLFPAGEDPEGVEILYAADQAFTLTAARIAKVRTLRVIRGALIAGNEASSSPPDAPLVARHVLSSEILTVPDSAEDEAAAPGAWATFGPTRTGISAVEVTVPATLGFAVASRYLLLTGGRRRVRFTVRFTAASADATLKPLLDELAAATGESPEGIFDQVLKQAFTLYLSTASGWLPVEYEVVPPASPPADLGGFELEFELPPSAPPIVAYDPAGDQAEAAGGNVPVSDDPAVNASNPDPELPTLKVYLRQQLVRLAAVEVYPLSLLGELELESFAIDTEVYDLADLEIENTDGEVDLSSPFAVFGGMPVVGSYLSIRHRELFEKTLEALRIRLRWFDLPPNDTGFRGYYRDYVIGLDDEKEEDLFDNRKFRVDIKVQNPGTWQLDEASPPDPSYLFRSHRQASPPDDDSPPAGEGCDDPVPDPDGRLCSATGFDHLRVAPSSPPPYYDPALSAIRLDLVEPAYAFGNDLYAKNVLNAVIEYLLHAETCMVECEEKCQVLVQAAECVGACIACIGVGGDPGDSPPDGRVERCLAKCRSCLEALEKCPPILEAISCIEACARGCREHTESAYAECVAACLETCRKNLEVAHEDCLNACIADCMSRKGELKYPNEPYLPRATSLSVDYAARCFEASVDEEGDCGTFYLLWPFGGYGRPSPPPPGGAPPLLPRFAYPGNLYLGFSRLIPPQTLTILFRMAADPGGGADPPQVFWEYLTNNCWTGLGTRRILSDTTGGLQGTGIVTLALPAFDPSDNTVASAETQWLRAAVKEPGRFPDTVAVTPQALTATWVDAGGSGEQLARPLPAHTITASVEDLPDVETIDQPIESFGGRPPETRRTFEMRLSERLRHKDRAILAWDYERLVLERFPTVWKVRVLPARDRDRGGVPGSVLVVIVPGPDSREVMDPTVPAASGDTLRRIEEYLKTRISPFVQVQVVNPVYVRIEVTARVLFAEQESAGALIEKLNRELVEYLSPWFYDAARAARGESYVSQADISEFVLTRPYVEALDSMDPDYRPRPESVDSDWYFLTSAKAHRIHDANAGEVPDDTCY